MGQHSQAALANLVGEKEAVRLFFVSMWTNVREYNHDVTNGMPGFLLGVAVLAFDRGTPANARHLSTTPAMLTDWKD